MNVYHTLCIALSSKSHPSPVNPASAHAPVLLAALSTCVQLETISPKSTAPEHTSCAGCPAVFSVIVILKSPSSPSTLPRANITVSPGSIQPILNELSIAPHSGEILLNAVPVHASVIIATSISVAAVVPFVAVLCSINTSISTVFNVPFVYE